MRWSARGFRIAARLSISESEGPMELCPAAPPRHRLVRRLGLATLVVVLGWLLLLTAVPAMLGLHGIVVRQGDAVTGVSAGGFAVARTVPTSEVRVGDLVVAGGHTGHQLRLVVDRPIGWLVTSDATDVDQPESTATKATTTRVLFTVPYVAWPLARLDAALRWALVLLTAGCLALALRSEIRCRRVSGAAEPTRARTSLV